MGTLHRWNLEGSRWNWVRGLGGHTGHGVTATPHAPPGPPRRSLIPTRPRRTGSERGVTRGGEPTLRQNLRVPAPGRAQASL